jgi:endonuclease-3
MPFNRGNDLPPGRPPARRARAARDGAALLRRVLARLRKRYGPREWQCWGDGISVLVDTILSQNTSAANSDAGFKRLRRRFRSWHAVADAPVDEVERCIRISGLSRQKAPRIQAILRQARERHRKMSLQMLADMGEKEAFEYLTAFKGVGPKTANCVLLFSFGKPVFPVDTHIHRIAIRLGLIPEKATADEAHELLKPMVRPRDRYEMHVLLIEHGRKTCKAISPLCEEYTLLRLCRTGQARVNGMARVSPG